jgi:endonuclease/exonuclease/phosphatase family metal-dependent hydrolase
MATFAATDVAGGLNPVNAIFFQGDQFDRVSAGGYWLSETPHVPGSRSWESAVVRLCNWICLRERESGKEFRYINTHLDHVSQTAREKQAAMINQDAAAYAVDYPQVLTGDMNANSSNPAVQEFFRAGWKDSYHAIHGVLEPGNSFHKFLGPAYPGNDGKIDWIFYRGKLRPTSSQIVTASDNHRYPSDHYFICADFDWE